MPFLKFHIAEHITHQKLVNTVAILCNGVIQRCSGEQRCEPPSYL